MKAVCHRCGGIKAGPFLPCPDCLHTPRDDDRALAWLFSSAHLSADELALAAHRIQAGEQPEPPPRLIEHAKANIASGRAGGGTPLSQRQVLALGVGSLVLTPLVGLSVWWGFRTVRPVAARQALRITVPIGAVMGALWLSVIALRLLG